MQAGAKPQGGNLLLTAICLIQNLIVCLFFYMERNIPNFGRGSYNIILE